MLVLHRSVTSAPCFTALKAIEYLHLEHEETTLTRNLGSSLPADNAGAAQVCHLCVLLDCSKHV